MNNPFDLFQNKEAQTEQESQRLKVRVTGLLCLFGALLLTYLGILFSLQIVHGEEYLSNSSYTIVKTETLDTDRGAFSLFCQYHAECELLFEVPPECFIPAPKVTSAVIRLTPRSTPPVDADEKALFAVIKAAFAQRRKTLLNGLTTAYGSKFSKEELRQAILDCGLQETVRGERLSLEDFARLSKILHN